MEKFIGCSGYYYNHWIGLFYPENMAKREWLSFYAEHFNTVEINNTFYRMPEEKAIKRWYEITPDDFVFSVKGFRFITHLKKLQIDQELLNSVDQFQRTVSLLKHKLGPILWQFPGTFKLNLAKLEKFCSCLSPEFHHVFEFRDAGWFITDVYDMLQKYHYGLCIVSSPGRVPAVIKVTSEIAYIRFHGSETWYDSNYSNDDLRLWKDKLIVLPAKKLFAYFNNDIHAYAIYNGEYFASLLEQKFSLTAKS